MVLFASIRVLRGGGEWFWNGLPTLYVAVCPRSQFPHLRNVGIGLYEILGAF